MNATNLEPSPEVISKDMTEFNLRSAVEAYRAKFGQQSLINQLSGLALYVPEHEERARNICEKPTYIVSFSGDFYLFNTLEEIAANFDEPNESTELEIAKFDVKAGQSSNALFEYVEFLAAKIVAEAENDINYPLSIARGVDDFARINLCTTFDIEMDVEAALRGGQVTNDRLLFSDYGLTSQRA